MFPYMLNISEYLLALGTNHRTNLLEVAVIDHNVIADEGSRDMLLQQSPQIVELLIAKQLLVFLLQEEGSRFLAQPLLQQIVLLGQWREEARNYAIRLGNLFLCLWIQLQKLLHLLLQHLLAAF